LEAVINETRRLCFNRQRASIFRRALNARRFTKTKYFLNIGGCDTLRALLCHRVVRGPFHFRVLRQRGSEFTNGTQKRHR
jgi:hypothetical protein